MNLKKLVFTGLKVGLILNLITVFGSIGYIVAIENYFKPFNVPSRLPFELGTIATARAMFDFDNQNDLRVLPRWQLIKNNFDFFVPDTALRDDDRAIKSPRLEYWCKINNNCWAHRIGYKDLRKIDYKTFTIDDWFIKNKSFLGTSAENSLTLPLDIFLTSLPSGSIVILNEPLTLFQQHPLNFQLFKNWVIILRRKHPRLKFKLGLQLHFQWLDSQWLRLQDGRLFSQFHQFSTDYDISWGISEFSIYDRIWRRRLVATYDRSGRRTDRLTALIESAVPGRLRRAIVLHQAYLVHRAVVRSGASFIVEWGNVPTIWFSGEIDREYRSYFALFDWEGRPLPMWWAVMRGLIDGSQ